MQRLAGAGGGGSEAHTFNFFSTLDWGGRRPVHERAGGCNCLVTLMLCRERRAKWVLAKCEFSIAGCEGYRRHVRAIVVM